MQEQLIETWAIHDRINRYLLDAIPDDALGASLPTKSRTVYDLFAHMHNVRLLWLKSADPALVEGLNKLDTKTVLDKRELARRSNRPAARSRPCSARPWLPEERSRDSSPTQSHFSVT